MENNKKRVVQKNKKYAEDYVSDFSTEQTSEDESEVNSDVISERDMNSTISCLIQKALPNVTNIQALSTKDMITGIKLSEESEEARATVKSLQPQTSHVDELIETEITVPITQSHVIDPDLAELIKRVSMKCKQLDMMTETVQKLRGEIMEMKAEMEPPEDLPPLPAAFPLKNIEEWKIFNNTTDKAEYRKIVNYFISLGGRSPNESINLMLSEAIDPALAKDLTWTGIGKNGVKQLENAVNKSRLYRACYAGLSYRNRFGKITRKELQGYISAGLKSAKERKRSADKKKARSENQLEENDSDMDIYEG